MNHSEKQLELRLIMWEFNRMAAERESKRWEPLFIPPKLKQNELGSTPSKKDASRTSVSLCTQCHSAFDGASHICKPHQPKEHKPLEKIMARSPLLTSSRTKFVEYVVLSRGRQSIGI
jgi:hypothetical protein